MHQDQGRAGACLCDMNGQARDINPPMRNARHVRQLLALECHALVMPGDDTGKHATRHPPS